MSVTTRWWWIRHAPVDKNSKGHIYGCTDVPCDLSDEKSIRALAETLPDNAVWVTSSLSRARDTGRAIAEMVQTTIEPIVEPDLNEQDFGDWHGLKWNQVEDAREYWRDPANQKPPGGESFSDVVERASQVVRRLNTEWEGRNIVAVAHAGIVRAALSQALGIAPERALAIKVNTLSLTRVDHIPPDGWKVSGMNLHGGWIRPPAPC
jgi:alpha-ribazole phosphatase